MQFVRHFLLAIQFFTRIPITGRLAEWVGYSPAMLRASAAHFAGVGWVVGLVAAAVAAGVLNGVQSVYAPLLAAALSTVATVMLTGGFHEDGLADVADGLGGTYGGDPSTTAGMAQRQRALDIMKDSRVGAFGAMALVLALVCKLALVAALADAGAAEPDAQALPAWLMVCVWMLCAHVVSRACPMVLVRVLPHVGDEASSKSKPLADQISVAALLSNFFWCICLLPVVIYAQAASVFIAGCVGSFMALWCMWRLLARRLQGFTGDGLGATQQVCELAFYLGVVLAL